MASCDSGFWTLTGESVHPVVCLSFENNPSCGAGQISDTIIQNPRLHVEHLCAFGICKTQSASYIMRNCGDNLIPALLFVPVNILQRISSGKHMRLSIQWEYGVIREDQESDPYGRIWRVLHTGGSGEWSVREDQKSVTYGRIWRVIRTGGSC